MFALLFRPGLFEIKLNINLVLVVVFTYSCVVSARRGFLFLCVLCMGCVTLLWQSLALPYNYFGAQYNNFSTVCPHHVVIMIPLLLNECNSKKAILFL